ncbi:hypothetical protein PspLS_07014 [Pyricularia sp. CBS 133598]|nr:hypothetical protein PspLS_07014 [Pyricularia sp. CBS 133598]
MYASTFLAILAATSAALVSANPVPGNEDSTIPKLDRRMFGFAQGLRPPAVTPAAAPPRPAPMCPGIWTGIGAFGLPTDGHCCIPGDRDALHCCMLTATTPLVSAPSELRCSNAYYSTTNYFNMVWRCNTGREEPMLCKANRVPSMPEVKAKYAPNGYIKFGEGRGRKKDPGLSRFGQHPGGNPAPAPAPLPVQVAKL